MPAPDDMRAAPARCGSDSQNDERIRVEKPARQSEAERRFDRSREPRKKPGIVSATALRAMTFDPVRFVVPGYLAEGLTLLAGRPKLGKSWLMLDMAIAVAAGGESLGVKCTRGEVLYIALEDNLRRLRSRLDQLMPTGVTLPSGLHFVVEWPRASAGGLSLIEVWLGEHPSARLIIIDVLAAFRDPRNGNEQLYDGDYKALKGLQELAIRAGVAIVVVHHTRKSGSEAGDPFEKVSGTLGLSGAADSVIVLDREGTGCTLYGRGRDIPEFEVAVEFDRRACRWIALGRADEVRRTDERKAILDELKQADEPLSPNEIAGATGMRQVNVRKLLSKMCRAGEVLKRGRARYIHPSSDRPRRSGCDWRRERRGRDRSRSQKA